MFALTKQEKVILIFLSLSFVSGLGISAYKKSQQKIELSVQPYKMAALQDADRLIEQHSKVNINSFKTDELTALPGVGPKLAERIIAHHRTHGAFRTKEELMQVKGIGEKTFEKIKGAIVLE
ncbi:MAG: helix-hairpin-helix domain-containing protein [Candidatus Omnitrophica bacterium]|nr:helix-hairpin-helix domain-containing protein [Candidatus Omnitrophota bacterium]